MSKNTKTGLLHAYRKRQSLTVPHSSHVVQPRRIVTSQRPLTDRDGFRLWGRHRTSDTGTVRCGFPFPMRSAVIRWQKYDKERKTRRNGKTIMPFPSGHSSLSSDAMSPDVFRLCFLSSARLPVDIQGLQGSPPSSCFLLPLFFSGAPMMCILCVGNLGHRK